MPVIGPGISKDDERVEATYNHIMTYLSTIFNIQRFPTKDSVMHALRVERNEEFKHALWKLFELESWESF